MRAAVEHRWISSGGVQILGHTYPEHTERVLACWWDRETEKAREREVALLRKADAAPVKLLRQATG